MTVKPIDEDTLNQTYKERLDELSELAIMLMKVMDDYSLNYVEICGVMDAIKASAFEKKLFSRITEIP